MIEVLYIISSLVVCVSLVGLLIWTIREDHKHQEVLIKAIKSKDAYEFKATTEPKREEEVEKPIDVIPMEDMDDKLFSKFIRNQNVANEEQ